MPPRLLWNASASAPIGLYLLLPRPPGRGALAVARLPEPVAELADRRGYLPGRALLIKKVAGLAGDVVCRRGPTLAVNGRSRAHARRTDPSGRPLPAWRGCRRLGRGEVLALSSQPDSFDGRYFGPLASGNVLGTALPLWIPVGSAQQY